MLDHIKDYQYDVSKFPEIPSDVSDESLYFLLKQLKKKSISTQRNFFSFLIISDKQDILDKLVFLWMEYDEGLLDEVFPSC